MKNYASAGAHCLPPPIEKAADPLGITGETEEVETTTSSNSTATLSWPPDGGRGPAAGRNLTPRPAAPAPQDFRDSQALARVLSPRSYASAFAFSASNSCCVIAPASSSSLAFAISPADPPPAVSRT
jgi:hypothetical protein